MGFVLLYSFERTDFVHLYISGDNAWMVPPVPIPNTVVKHPEAESTCLVTGREDRKLPVDTKSTRFVECFFVCKNIKQPLPQGEDRRGAKRSARSGSLAQPMSAQAACCRRCAHMPKHSFRARTRATYGVRIHLSYREPLAASGISDH